MFRDEWGKIYQTFFTSGRNRKAMDLLEKVSEISILPDMFCNSTDMGM